MWAEVKKERMVAFVGPSDLDPLLGQTREIWRFKGVAEGRLEDSVYDHVSRCRLRATMLPLSQKSWWVLDRILQLHDLPEIETGDYLAHQIVARKGFLPRLRAQEKLALETLGLSLEDKKLIRQFQLASDALEGKRAKEPILAEAILARIIDVYDAVELFHIVIPCWVDTTLNLDPKEMPDSQALIYAIDLYETYMVNLPDLGLNNQFLSLSRNLLINMLDWVNAHWSQVPQERIPRRMRKRLRRAQEELATRETKNLPGLENFFPLILF